MTARLLGALFVVPLLLLASPPTEGRQAPTPPAAPAPNASAPSAPAATATPTLPPKLILAAGFLASRLQNQTFTTVTPAPNATPSNGLPVGTYVYGNENSTSQVSVPLFAHYRLVNIYTSGANGGSSNANGKPSNANGTPAATPVPTRLDLYGSVGYSASLKQGTLFGLSLGLDSTAFLTVAIHSQTINILCPNVNASTGLVYAPGTSTPAAAGSGAPTLCATRTAKPAVGITLPIDVFTTFVGNLSKVGS